MMTTDEEELKEKYWVRYQLFCLTYNTEVTHKGFLTFVGGIVEASHIIHEEPELASWAL